MGRGPESDLGSNAGTGGLGIASQGFPDPFPADCLNAALQENSEAGFKGTETKARPWVSRPQHHGQRVPVYVGYGGVFLVDLGAVHTCPWAALGDMLRPLCLDV